mgnify:CR=1 FL=1
MKNAHQQFSALARRSGELDKPGKRRRNLTTGRISVTLGADLAALVEHDGAAEDRSAGGFIRKIVLEHYKRKGLSGPALADRAAELRAAKVDA